MSAAAAVAVVAAAAGIGAGLELLTRVLADGNGTAGGKDGADSLTEKINAELPQLQCGECDFPGCRPYAAAIARGEVGIDKCPPGGTETAARLAELLNVDMPAPLPPPVAKTAVIREGDCVGCGLCLAACPTDAIVGAARFAHTVRAADCVGCELCLPPCPVDCIDIVAVGETATAEKIPLPSAKTAAAPCINCNKCTPVCPAGLSPLRLYALARDEKLAELQNARLPDCVECRRCDAACPSDIPLAAVFAAAKKTLAARAAEKSRRAHWQELHDRRAARLEKTAPQFADAGALKNKFADLINRADSPSAVCQDPPHV